MRLRPNYALMHHNFCASFQSSILIQHPNQIHPGRKAADLQDQFRAFSRDAAQNFSLQVEELHRPRGRHFKLQAYHRRSRIWICLDGAHFVLYRGLKHRVSSIDRQRGRRIIIDDDDIIIAIAIPAPIRIEGQQWVIQVGELLPGMYLLKYSIEGESRYKKVVIQ